MGQRRFHGLCTKDLPASMLEAAVHIQHLAGGPGGVVAAQIGDAAMPQPDEILRRFLSGEKIVVVDVDRLIGVSIGFSDQYIILLFFV